ncbi:MAG: MGH1-like glycoside hydrolase domain-containing protein, partial [Planctomycetota bacterium]
EGRMRIELRPVAPRAIARRALLLVEFAASPPFESRFAGLSQGSPDAPIFEGSPFEGALARGRLSGEVLLHDWENDGQWNSGFSCQVHVGLARRARIPARGRATFAFGARLRLLRAPRLERRRPPAPVARVLARGAIEASTRSWTSFLEGVPSFECDDPFLERFWWHRWAGLRLHAVDAGAGFLRRPCVFEGAEAFRAAIPYSVQAQVRECAWMRDPALAEGSLLGILESMNRRGEIPGHVRLLDTSFDRPAAKGYPFPYRTTFLADLGGCALLLFSVHRRSTFVREVYPLLERHAEHWRRDRDREGSGLFDVRNQGETGQEYSTRYLAVDRRADRRGPIRLKGIDAAVYAHGLHR